MRITPVFVIPFILLGCSQSDECHGDVCREPQVRHGVAEPDHDGPVSPTPAPHSRSPDGSGLGSDQPESLSPLKQLVRISIDLRGQRPSPAEIRQVRDDSSALAGLVEEFLLHPAFAVTVSDLATRSLRNRFSDYAAPGQEDLGESDYQVSVAQEPVRLMRHLVLEDRSYNEFLTADFTFADEHLAGTWPLSGYDVDVGGWQRVQYSDGRPAAGYLAMNSFYLRFLSDGINYNRGRANAVSRALLCDDYLKRPIDFPRNIDLTDEEGIMNAVRENPGCASCHATLDPFASYFTPFSALEDTDGGRYDADGVDAWEETTQAAPAYGGRRGQTIADLSRQIVADPRYGQCFTRRMYEGMLDREATLADADALESHTRVFVESGLNIRALFRSLVADAAYLGRRDGERLPTYHKLLSPEKLGDVIESMTGFKLVRGRVDLMRDPNEGYLVLGGGLSALAGTRPSNTANVSRVLVQGRLAESAAYHLVNEDPAKLTVLIGATDLSRESLSVERASALLEAFHAQPAADTSSSSEDYVGLFDELVARGLDLETSWMGIIATMLRDPAFQVY
jgi:hypothetical protein